jgi:hypothetical protein
MIKLEVGKCYKTRDGRKAKCVHIHETGNPHSRCIVVFDNPARTLSYSEAGYIYPWDTDDTIVSEWVEPKQFKYDLAVFECITIDGEKIYYLQDLSRLDTVGLNAIVAKRTITITEGDGL